MSHFIGIVFVDERIDNLDTILAPYDEQTEDDAYLEFRDCTDEVKQKWDSLDEDDLTKRQYETISEFAKDYFGFRKTTDADGNTRYGYMSNPRAEWDWWTIGGRWSGFLKGKDGDNHNELSFDDVDWDKMIDEHIPFCFVDAGGEWNERAKMGWWGMTSDDKDNDEWVDMFKEYVSAVKALDEEDRENIGVYAVDFHI